MKALFVFLLLAATVQAGQWCNNTEGEDGTIFDAFPIDSFSTAGDNSLGQNWCVSACGSRTSVRATIGSQSAVEKREKFVPIRTRQFYRKSDTAKYFNDNEVQPRIRSMDDFRFCVDLEVQTAVTNVFTKYDTTDDITTQLKATINKQGWGYLVVKMSQPPGSVGASFSHDAIDNPDFCYSAISKYNQVSQVAEMFGLISGLVAA